jgi:cbb3-type cytochrome oxidase subunit 3
MNVVTGIREVRHAWAWLAAIAVLSTVPYWRTLDLPPIEDDYVQIWLGRIYGAPSQWGDLFSDPLYRCRATSIVLTRATEEIFGNIQVVFNLQSLLLHACNAVLVAFLGLWRPIGFRLSIAAAFFWGLSQRLHEAVIWYAALPEQLVFFFVLLAFLFWIHWWQSKSRAAYAAAGLCYILALLSKESGVVFCGLAALPLFFDTKRWKEMAYALAPFGLIAAAYFLLNVLAKSNHLHWNDGTFQLGWHFILVILNSSARIFWVWGIVALVVLYLARKSVNWSIVAIAAAWIVICLLPYSFLSYMPRVPSRHVYLAMVGRSLILAVALAAVWRYRRVTAMVAALFVVTNSAYIAFFKRSQFVARANVTEKLVQEASKLHGEAYEVECFPHAPELAEFALNQRLGVDLKKVKARRDGNCQSMTIRVVP